MLSSGSAGRGKLSRHPIRTPNPVRQTAASQCEPCPSERYWQPSSHVWSISACCVFAFHIFSRPGQSMSKQPATPGRLPALFLMYEGGQARGGGCERESRHAIKSWGRDQNRTFISCLSFCLFKKNKKNKKYFFQPAVCSRWIWDSQLISMSCFSRSSKYKANR